MFLKHKTKDSRENVNIHLIEYSLPQFPAHWHTDAEMIMVTAGTLIVGYNFDSYTLYAGDFMLIPGGNIHHFSTLDNGRALLLFFEAEIVLNEEEANAFSIPVIIENSDVSMFRDIYDRIYDEWIHAETAYKMMIKSYLGLLSAWILRNRTESSILKSKQIKRKLLNDSQKLFKYIGKNYDKKITLEVSANLMHLEKNYFCRYFKSLTGTTFARYVNIIRIQAAQNMLRSTDLAVNEIASRCGFETFRTFNREFKTITGVTAMQYRQNNQ